VRWRHPTRGLLPAAAFIGIAEESGLVGEIGRFVLREACRQAGEWRRAFPELNLTLRVNISARQLVEPKLLREIDCALATGGLDPHALCLEITERVLVNDAPSVVQMLRWIRDLGVRIAIDDFGTGYSSLGYLERFPVDSIKIDRSFVAGLGTEAKSAAIIRTLVSLAAALDVDVVAEGVETREQHEVLAALGCRRGQGFLFAPALAVTDVDAILRTGEFPRR
jgi:EAL domain-containing protein (putative c-di-GMP-specific phosphodiesterase class I)